MCYENNMSKNVLNAQEINVFLEKNLSEIFHNKYIISQRNKKLDDLYIYLYCISVFDKILKDHEDEILRNIYVIKQKPFNGKINIENLLLLIKSSLK